MIIEKKTMYNLLDIDEDVLKTIEKVFLNSTRQSLNNYLEGRGGMPNIISCDEMTTVFEFANTLRKVRSTLNK